MESDAGLEQSNTFNESRMSHKAGGEFFEAKKDWSHRKDLVLKQYLVPYLPKIATQQRPVLVIDGFAGPGRFGDGTAGSPVIICSAVQRVRQTVRSVNFFVWCVESSVELADALDIELRPFSDFASLKRRRFQDLLPEITHAIISHNIFLYLDPFTVTGLSWNALDQLFSQVDRTRSVEVLLNFNVFALARAACIAVGKRFAIAADDSAMLGESASTRAAITEVLGGDWWIQPFVTSQTFSEACGHLVRGYSKMLRGRFAEVCLHEIKDQHDQAIPNYVLAFGSRHPDAFELMNDAMAKSLKRQAAKEAPAQPMLIELRPESLVPERQAIQTIVREVLAGRATRGETILRVMRHRFGVYTRPEIRGVIEEMLKIGTLGSESRNARINDDVLIWLK